LPRLSGWLPRSFGWLLAAFAVVLVLVHTRTLEGLDSALRALAEGPGDCRLIELSNAANLLFSAEGCLVLSGLSSLLLLRAGYGPWSLVPWLVFASVPIEIAAKLWVHQPMPALLTWPAQAGCDFNEPGLNLLLPYSFPSGHMTRATYFVALLGALAGGLRQPRARALALTLALVVVVAIAVERVYRGVHWPSDVAGGLLLGSALALVAARHLARQARLALLHARDRDCPDGSGPRRSRNFLSSRLL
jgi:membrane-associated phospholipid phosphatase